MIRIEVYRFLAKLAGIGSRERHFPEPSPSRRTPRLIFRERLAPIIKTPAKMTEVLPYSISRYRETHHLRGETS
jgi:hypothetical protein